MRPGRRTCVELERIIVERHRSGSLGREDAHNLFDELLPQARPASVHAFNRVLTVVARADSSSPLRHSAALAVSLFNTMARAGVNKVAADICTFGILIRWTSPLLPLARSSRWDGGSRSWPSTS